MGSLFKRLVALIVLLVVAAIALKLVASMVFGIVASVWWLIKLAVIVAAGVWAWSVLTAAKRSRRAKRQGALDAAPDDPLAALRDELDRSRTRR